MQTLNPVFFLAVLATIFAGTSIVQGTILLRWLNRARAAIWLAAGLVLLTAAGGLTWVGSRDPYQMRSAVVSQWGPEWQCLSVRGQICFKRPVLDHE